MTSFSFPLPLNEFLFLSSFAAVSFDSRRARARAASLRATSASLCARIIDASSINFNRAASRSGKKSRMLMSREEGLEEEAEAAADEDAEAEAEE
jgi:hypothetical protein